MTRTNREVYSIFLRHLRHEGVGNSWSHRRIWRRPLAATASQIPNPSKASEPTETWPPTSSNCSHRYTMMRCSPRGSLPLSTLHISQMPMKKKASHSKLGTIARGPLLYALRRLGTPVGKDPRWSLAPCTLSPPLLGGQASQTESLL